MHKLSDLLLTSVPRYGIDIPSSGKHTTYRPFLVKEEKVLLLAQESSNESDMILAIQNIIETCIEDDLDVGNMPLFDIEYIFLQIRSKSVGEIITPTIICPVTNEPQIITINIPDIKIIKPPKHSNKIKIQEDIILTMKYPSLNMLIKSNGEIDYTNPSSFYNIITECVVSIQTKEETIDATSLPPEEVSDFIDNMTVSQFESVLEFFLTSPRMECITTYTTSDDVEREVVMSGLSDFFG